MTLQSHFRNVIPSIFLFSAAYFLYFTCQVFIFCLAGTYPTKIFSAEENRNKIFIEKIFDFKVERKNFVETATELAALVASRFETKIFPNQLTRDLVQNAYELSSYVIKFSSERSHGMRRIRMELLSGDGNITARLRACATICARLDSE